MHNLEIRRPPTVHAAHLIPFLVLGISVALGGSARASLADKVDSELALRAGLPGSRGISRDSQPLALIVQTNGTLTPTMERSWQMACRCDFEITR